MVRAINVFTALAGLFTLAACSLGQQSSQSGSPIVPFASSAEFRATLAPEEDCRGFHGVAVAPCPILLTKDTQSGIVVTVSGPGVVDSTARKRPCSKGKLCYHINRANSADLNQWRLTSGRYCGAADIEFFGLDSLRKKVGYAFLSIINMYCP